jgi:hypothetical protein
MLDVGATTPDLRLKVVGDSRRLQWRVAMDDTGMPYEFHIFELV